MLKEVLFGKAGVSWDMPEEMMIQYYGADYKTKLKITD